MRSSAMALVFLGAACSDGSGPSSCNDVQVTVSAGTTPQFSWTGACPAYSLEVSGPSANMWYVSGGEVLDDVIQPPVQYATVPVGSVQSGPAAALESGTEYTVRLDRRNRFGGGVTFLAERTFTP